MEQDNQEKKQEKRAPAIPARGPGLADDSGVPASLTRLSILVGLGLAVAGAAMMWLVYPRLFNAGSLAMCIGFGLVLAALGTRVAGTWQSWSVAGGGGMAIVLFLLLHALPSPPPDPVPTSPFVRGNLHGTNEATSVRMFGAQFMLVGRGNTSDHFRFIAFPDDLKSANFYVLIVNEKDPALREAYIGCIPTAFMLAKMKSNEVINLSVEKDRESAEYRLRDLLDGKELGEFGSPQCGARGTPNRPKAADAPSRLRFAAAGEILERAATMFGISALAQGKQPTIDDLLRALEADSSDIRATSRDQLAKLRDPASLSQMAASWDIAKSSYRADLGRVVAWTYALRQEKEAAVRLSAALSPDQLGYLVRLTGHADKTMRYNATEVLSWMLQSTGWPVAPTPDKSKALLDEITKVFSGPDAIRITKPGVEFDFGNTAFNTLVAVDDAKCVLKPDARQSLTAALALFEKKYGSELQKTVSMSQGVRGALAKPGC